MQPGDGRRQHEHAQREEESREEHGYMSLLETYVRFKWQNAYVHKASVRMRMVSPTWSNSGTIWPGPNEPRAPPLFLLGQVLLFLACWANYGIQLEKNRKVVYNDI